MNFETMNNTEDIMNLPIETEEDEISQTKSVIKVGKRLKMLRNKAGYSAAKACEKLKELYQLEISVNSLDAYESDRRLPNIQVFFALCELYGCNDISGFFEVSANAKTKTKITLEDFGPKELVELIFQHYNKENCLDIVHKMIDRLTEL